MTDTIEVRPPLAGPTPGAPLAEGRWLWRRLYVFASSGAAWLLIDRLIVAVPPAETGRLVQGLMALLALTLILYLVAPSAQQIIAAVVAFRQGGGEGRP